MGLTVEVVNQTHVLSCNNHASPPPPPLILCALLRVTVYPSHRVMHDHLSPLPILLLIIIWRPTNTIRWRTYPQPHIYILTGFHSCQILFPSVRTEHLSWDNMIPVVRAIEVSHAACKDEFRRNLRPRSWRFLTKNNISYTLWVYEQPYSQPAQ